MSSFSIMVKNLFNNELVTHYYWVFQDKPPPPRTPTHGSKDSEP
jgi:hypothetical protein